MDVSTVEHNRRKKLRPGMVSYMWALISPLIFMVFLILSFTTETLPINQQHQTHSKIPSQKKEQPKFPFENAVDDILSSPHISMNKNVSHSIQTFSEIVLTDYHEKHSRKPGNEKFFVARLDRSPTHGLGDRVRAVITGFFLSVISNRKFLIQWTTPIPLSTIFTSSHPSLNFTYDPLIHKDDDDDVVVNGQFYWRMDSYENISVVYLDSVPEPNVTVWFQPSSATKNNDILLRLSKLSTALPTCITMPIILKSILKPTPQLRKWIYSRTSKMSLLNRSYISVHARLGYGLNEDEKDSSRFDLNRRGTSLKGMAKCLAYYTISKSAHMEYIYLATDTSSFTPLFIEQVKRFAPKKKVVFLNSNVKHIRDLGRGTEEDKSLLFDTFTDLFLLAGGNAIVNLRSGFSDLAAWMGAICNQTVITHEDCARRFGNGDQIGG